MNNTQWKFRWFGFWKEKGEGYKNYPSLHQYIAGSSSVDYSPFEEELISYLTNCYTIAVTSRIGFPCLICGERFGGSVGCCTDGEWVWFDDIVHYISEHQLPLPQKFLDKIIAVNFATPDVDQHKDQDIEEFLDMSKLEFPPD